MTRARRNGSRMNHGIVDRLLDHLENEFRDKPQGYMTKITVGRELFPATMLPSLEIILLDPQEKRVAFRKVSDPLAKGGQGIWHVGELFEVVEEAFHWNLELQDEYSPDAGIRFEGGAGRL